MKWIKENINLVLLLIMIVIGNISWILHISGTSRELSKYKQQLALEQAAQDSMRVYYDKEIESYVAERQTLSAEKDVLENFLQDRDSRLSALMKKYDGLAGVISKLEARMDTTVLYDTVYLDTAGRETRIAKIQDEFRDITVTSTPDSVELKPFRIFTDQSVVIGEDGKVRVIHTNPYLNVTELNSFYVQPPAQKSKNWKYFVGLAAGLGGGYLILK